MAAAEKRPTRKGAAPELPGPDKTGGPFPAALSPLSAEEQQAVFGRLCAWYTAHRRRFPWRERPEPYRVWLSEIMLQQTRIEAAIPYYERFLQTLPTVRDLAAAEETLVLKLWEGLGYYSRVRHMQQAARQIEERFAGVFPQDYAAIRSLPGIGDYTAGAIASICFGVPVPAVDGNVLRVLARLWNDPADVMLPATKKRAAERLLPVLRAAESPGDLNQAIMELGETVCLPNGAPLCERCPLAEDCRARAAGTAAVLPVRTVKTKKRREERTVLVCITRETPPRLLLHRRPKTGLLAGLYELPSLDGVCAPEAAREAVLSAGAGEAVYRESATGRHVFSHLEWHMTAHVFLTDVFSPPAEGLWVTPRQLQDTVALPSAFRPFFPLLQTYFKEE